MAGSDSKNAAQAINTVCYMDEQLHRISSRTADEGAGVKSLIESYLAAQAMDTLEGIGVDELNRRRLGIRVSALKNAGYVNIRQIVEAPLQKVINVNGLSEETARIVKNVSGKMLAEAQEGATVRLSLDNKTEAASALVKEIYIRRNGKALFEAAANLYEKSHAAVSAAVKDAEIAKGGLLWMFASGAKKSAARKQLENIEHMLAGSYGSGVTAMMNRSLALESTPEDACWADFEKNSASYYAVIEKADPGSISEEMRYGLSTELVAEIEAVEIDITGLKCTLRSYQEFGVQYVLKQGFALLGDEMGLGKTVQAIATMVALRNRGATHFLVVCPASVIVNWCREIAQHSDLKPIKLHGADFENNDRLWKIDGGVAVTTYETLGKFAMAEDFRYALLVADEAHYAKNPNAQRTINLLAVKLHAERALFMTGTPLENNVEEMCFLLGCLKPDVTEQISGMMYLSTAPQFREKIASVYFRRTRDDVLTELPEKIESEEWCEMTAEEKARYYSDVRTGQFMSMRQVSWNIPDMNKSSKAQRLLELCEMAKEEDRKIIIFSFFINTVNHVKELLGTRCYGPITGSVPPKKRQEIIDEFNAAPGGSAIVAQIQAGGTGLNIQAASVVILCEPQIKPSIENQAISRAYRMGQVRSVLVYRLLCENSVDERIMEILSTKQELFDNFAEESVSGRESLQYSEQADETAPAVPAPGTPSTNDIIALELKRIEEESGKASPAEEEQ